MRTTTLANKATIYLPAKHKAVVLPLLKVIRNIAGGLTAVNAEGTWVGKDDIPVEEGPYLVHVHYGADWVQRHETERAIMRLIAALLDAGEEAVLVEFNGGAVLYEKDAE